MRGRYRVLLIRWLPVGYFLLFLCGLALAFGSQQGRQRKRGEAFASLDKMLELGLYREAEQAARRLNPETNEEWIPVLRAHLENDHYEEALRRMQTRDAEAAHSAYDRVVHYLVERKKWARAYQALRWRRAARGEEESSAQEAEQFREVLSPFEQEALDAEAVFAWFGKDPLALLTGPDGAQVRNAQGEVLRADLSWDEAGLLETGFYARVAEQWMAFDAKGNFLSFRTTPPEPFTKKQASSSEWLVDKKDGKWGITSKYGMIMPAEWDEITEVSPFGVAFARKGEQWVMIRFAAASQRR